MELNRDKFRVIPHWSIDAIFIAILLLTVNHEKEDLKECIQAEKCLMKVLPGVVNEVISDEPQSSRIGMKVEIGRAHV